MVAATFFWKKLALMRLPSVATPSDFAIAYVTGLSDVFVSVSGVVCGPAAPSPSETLPGDTVCLVVSAVAIWISPPPWRCTGSSAPLVGSCDQAASVPVVCSSSRTFVVLPLRSGFACSSRATAPVTCGEAIDVPDSLAYELFSIGNVDRMFPPGAPRSGLRLRSAARPYDEKSDTNPPTGLGVVIQPAAQVSDTARDCRDAASAVPSASGMRTTGIVIAEGPATVMLARPGASL